MPKADLDFAGSELDAKGSSALRSLLSLLPSVVLLLLLLPPIKSLNGSLISAPGFAFKEDEDDTADDEDEGEGPIPPPSIPRLKFGAALLVPDIILPEL
jgi:hypothetical protein